MRAPRNICTVLKKDRQSSLIFKKMQVGTSSLEESIERKKVSCDEKKILD